MAKTKLKGNQVETFTTTIDGVVPAPTTVSGKVLSDNGTWITPPGGGSGLTFQEVYRVNTILNNL